VFIVIGLVMVLIAGLGYVFFQNYQHEQSLKASANKTAEPTPSSPTEEKVANLDVNNWKTYQSFTGSGLSFKYPAEWSFTPSTKQIVMGNGAKILPLTLTSLKSGEDKSNKYMCVQLTERVGGGQFTKISYPGDANSIGEFFVGTSPISLHKDQYGLQLYNKDSSARYGALYVPLNNDFVLTAIAQYNCGNSDKKILDTDPAVKQAELILKSIQVSS
jgi:hypothetical protein